MLTVHCSCRSSSLTAPNGPSQRALVGIALDFAQASAAEVGYVAIHGTGTPLGDPIEVGALSGALSNQHHHLHLGSVKVLFTLFRLAPPFIPKDASPELSQDENNSTAHLKVT